MARYVTEWPKMCLTYLTYLMCLRIWDGLYYFFSEPYLTYLTCLCIWDFPQNIVCHVFDVFTCLRILDLKINLIWPHIWRVYVFDIFARKIVCHVFDVFTCLRIWDFSKKKVESVFDVFLYLRFLPEKWFATYLTFSRVYVFETFPKKKFESVFDVFL